jgi:hypothetical protein
VREFNISDTRCTLIESMAVAAKRQTPRTAMAARPFSFSNPRAPSTNRAKFQLLRAAQLTGQCSGRIIHFHSIQLPSALLPSLRIIGLTSESIILYTARSIFQNSSQVSLGFCY